MAEFLEMIDTHAHFILDDYLADTEALLERCRNGIFPEIHGKIPDSGPCRIVLSAIVSPGISVETSRQIVECSKKYSLIKPAVAIHPNYTAEANGRDWSDIEKLSENQSVVAIGETGLDCHWDHSPLATQMEFFTRHIELAKRWDKPVIIHSREADESLLPILRRVRAAERVSNDPRPLRGVIHSFSSGPLVAAELLEMGFYLGFTGSVTYRGEKFAPIADSARQVPDNRLLLETDSPFLTPHPFRGKLERNEPLMAVFVARRLAELRSTTVEEILRLTAENARRLFRL